jgi:hypothetical protein
MIIKAFDIKISIGLMKKETIQIQLPEKMQKEDTI